MKILLRHFSVFFFVAVAVSLNASDYPQWRGPQRDGVSQETGLLKEWPAGGPKLKWQITNAGLGYSTPSVVGSRIYLLGNKGLQEEFVESIDSKDGKQLWSTTVGKVGNPAQQPNFPAARSTPTIDGELLFALGSDGNLVCLETKTGKLRWSKNLRSDFGGKPGEWAYSESPLVDGDALICTPGGTDALIVALKKNTGALIWKTTSTTGEEEAAYSSPVIAESGGVKQYIQVLKKGLVGVAAKSGKLLWRYPKMTSRYGANIPTPMVCDGYIYSAGAGTGGGLVKLKANGNDVQADQVYFSPKLPTAIGGVVKIGDVMYGTTGQSLVCFDFATGNVKWEDPALGAAALCYAEDRLYLHSEKGDVALIEATPTGYHEKGRFTPPNQPKRVNEMEKPWAYPVVANGNLYIRDHNLLWCYDVKGR